MFKILSLSFDTDQTFSPLVNGPVNDVSVQGLTSRSTHFGDDFYRPDDQTNSVKALKETRWSSKIRLESNQNHSTMLQ